MNRTAKTIAGVVAAVIPFVIVIGCTSSEGGASPPSPASASSAPPGDNKEDVYPENGLSKTEKVTIKWGYWENAYGREWADNAIKKFTAKYPNVKFEVTASPVIRELIGIKMAAKNDKDMFDIISPTFNSIEEGTVAQKEGLFEDLTDLWDREVPDKKGVKLKDVVLDSTMQYALKVDGKFYQIPMGAYALGLFYDKTFFEKNGWNQNPKTWDEFKKLITDIKAKGIIPITYPGVYATYIYYGFTIKQFELAQKKGTLDPFTKDFRSGKWPIYTSPEYKEIWSRLYELGKLGAFPEGAAAMNHTQSQMQLLQHKAALASTGDWVQNEMKDSIPEGFKWGFMDIPFVDKPGDTIWVENGIGAGSMMIWKNKPELTKKWAKEFNLFLMTNEIQAFNGKYGISPIRKDFADNPDNIAQLQEAPRAVLEYVQTNKARFGTAVKDVAFTHPSAGRATKMVTDMIVEVASGKKDPMPVLEEADKLMKEAIEAEKK
ncbi:ABC transporter substrate-binding protein [Paenibacillus sp. MBLB4367]|uniref:ABC transporter substrate-binding protein n=1 Tax=Paenibacillus sp. MBLB4367 TaxID=3384767 RepID=UPI003907F39D